MICCELHKTGKYTHWPCSDAGYSPEERSERHQRDKTPCIDCKEPSSKYSSRCIKCSGVTNGESMRGRKLPMWWRKRISEGQKGEKHPNWKGNDVGYSALHKWVYRNLKKGTECCLCKRTKNLQFANKTGKYLRDRNDWLTLCCKCHCKFDKVKKDKRFVWKDNKMIKRENITEV